jgi:hypothetical protein
MVVVYGGRGFLMHREDGVEKPVGIGRVSEIYWDGSTLNGIYVVEVVDAIDQDGSEPEPAYANVRLATPEEWDRLAAGKRPWTA